MQLYQISLLENAYRVDPIPEILHAQAEKEIQLVLTYRSLIAVHKASLGRPNYYFSTFSQTSHPISQRSAGCENN